MQKAVLFTLTTLTLFGCSSHINPTDQTATSQIGDLSCEKIETEISAERDKMLTMSFLQGYAEQDDDDIKTPWLKIPNFNTEKNKNKKDIAVSQQRIKILANLHKEKDCDQKKIAAHPISTSAFFARDVTAD